MTRTMKDSGVEWIDQIPKSWSTKKLKFCSNIITGNTPSKSNYDLYYSENGILWVKPDDLNDFVPVTNTKEKLTKLGSGIAKIVPEETPLICCIGSIGKLGFSNQKVAFNQQINAVCFNTSIINKKFGFYFLYTQEAQHNFYANGNVLKILNSENHKRIQIPLPPLPEQQAIADYLDDKCAQIDNITATINEQIEVLKQYKKSVITEAVTKGLNPNAPMKDSGVEWIGQIPKQWNVKPIYTTFSEVIDKNYTGDVKTALRFSFGTIIPKENFNSDEDDYVANTIKNYTIVEPGNIVINGLNLNYDFVTKRVAIVNDFGAITSAYISIKPDANKAYPKFMLYLLKSYDHCRAFHGMGEGVRKILNYSELKKNKVILPPLPEQQAIADYLDDKCAKIDAVIADKQTQLETLAAYKKSLIYEYVTGKKSVPGFEEA